MVGSSGSGCLAWSGAGTRRWPWCGGLQELVDEIIQLGHMPTQSKNASIEEKRLARRLVYVRNGIRRAGKAKKLSLEQEAELEALQQEPRDVRAQGGDTGTAIRRRPAARNAEEDRRLSRRTDAS